MPELRLNQINLTGGTQPRERIDADVVSEYSEALIEGAKFPPVVVFHDGKNHWLADGFHRHAAHVKADFRTIDCTVKQGSQRDAILYSVGANNSHGVRRTNADKKRAVLKLVEDEEWGAKSANWIADKCGVSVTFASKVKSESPLSTVDSQGRDGRTINTSNIGLASKPRPSKHPIDAMPAGPDRAAAISALPGYEVEQKESNPRRESSASPDDAEVGGYSPTIEDKPLRLSPAETFAQLEDIIATGKKFGCIYADPAWKFDNQVTRAATDNHYPTMTLDEICALPIKELAADDAHLHLWIVNAFLFDAPRIFDAWGFEFKSTFVWVKGQLGIGNYWRNSHEILLTAVRGNAKRFNDHSLKSWGEFDRTRHSEKPYAIREFIERASDGPYLELFGRATHDNWTVWGNEVVKGLYHDVI